MELELFGFKLISKSSYENLINLGRMVNEATSPKPSQSDIGYGTQPLLSPQIHLLKLRAFVYSSPEYRMILNRIRQEVFRKAIKIKENKYEDKSYEHDKNQKSVLQKIMKKANSCGQTFEDVMRQFDEDLRIYDNGFLTVTKEYQLDSEGNIISAEAKELNRADPVFMTKLINEKGEYGYYNGRRVYVTLENRNKLLYEEEAKKSKEKVYPVYFIEKAFNDKNITAYIEGECLHKPRYTPTKHLGIPPAFTLFVKVNTILIQDRYLLEYFAGMKSPRGVLTVNGKNAKGIIESWNRLVDQIQTNPHMVYPWIVEGTEGNKTVVQYLDLMRSLPELQFTEVRQEYRRALGSFYGVSNLFMNDLEQSGGLNNESQQITTTNRSTEAEQEFYEEGIFPWILEQFGITDYELEFDHVDEKDEFAEQKILSAKIENAQKMKQLGVPVVFNENHEFEYLPAVIEQSDESGENLSDPYEQLNNNLALKKKDEINEEELQDKLNERIKEFLSQIDFQNKDEVQGKLNDLTERLIKKLRKASKTELKNVYREELKKISREIGVRLPFTSTDEDLIDSFSNNQTFLDSLDNIKSTIFKKGSEIVQKGLQEKLTLDQITNALINELDIIKKNAQNIARTESQALQNIARETSYKKLDDGSFKYFWIGPEDYRTTLICKKIKARTKRGVTLDQLKKIIREEADLKTYLESKSFTPHLQCRHIFVRK